MEKKLYIFEDKFVTKIKVSNAFQHLISGFFCRHLIKNRNFFYYSIGGLLQVK